MLDIVLRQFKFVPIRHRQRGGVEGGGGQASGLSGGRGERLQEQGLVV